MSCCLCAAYVVLHVARQCGDCHVSCRVGCMSQLSCVTSCSVPVVPRARAWLVMCVRVNKTCVPGTALAVGSWQLVAAAAVVVGGEVK